MGHIRFRNFSCYVIIEMITDKFHNGAKVSVNFGRSEKYYHVRNVSPIAIA